MCILYIYNYIYTYNIDQYCTCTYDQCLNPLPATQLRSNNAWPRAPLQRPLRMQPAPRGRRATGDRDSVDLGGELGALEMVHVEKLRHPTHQIIVISIIIYYYYYLLLSIINKLWISIIIYLSLRIFWFWILNSKLPLHWWDLWLSAMSPLDGLMSGAPTPVQVQSWRFFARISMQGILTSPSECVFCLFINIPKMKQIVEFWWERYTSITLPLICLNVLVLTGYLFGYCWLYAWLFGIASPWHPTNQNPGLPFWYI